MQSTLALGSLLTRSPRTATVFTTRARLGIVALWPALIVACAPKVAPPTPAPVPAPVEAVPTPVAPTRWTLAADMPLTHYRVQLRAQLERDSAGRSVREQVETRAQVALQLRRDSTGLLRGSGRVDSFTVRGLERALSTSSVSTDSAAQPLSITFDAVLDSTSARVSAKPALTNECDQREAGATALVRELLVRIPGTVGVGDRWRDSTTAFICRAGVPITLRIRAESVVERAQETNGRTELVVRRSVETRLDGAVRTTWRTLELSGSGRSSQVIRVDVAQGNLRSIEGESTLTLKVSDSARRDDARSQTITQKTELKVTSSSP